MNQQWLIYYILPVHTFKECEEQPNEYTASKRYLQ